MIDIKLDALEREIDEVFDNVVLLGKSYLIHDAEDKPIAILMPVDEYSKIFQLHVTE